MSEELRDAPRSSAPQGEKSVLLLCDCRNGGYQAKPCDGCPNLSALSETVAQGETPRTDELVRDILADRYGRPMQAAISLIDTLERENADLKRQLAEARKDAERYRWLREGCEVDPKRDPQDIVLIVNGPATFGDADTFSVIDAAIDAALKEAGK